MQLKDWQRQALKVSALVIFSLGILRLAFVVAPIFEPPVDRVYAAVETFFLEDTRKAQTTQSSTSLPQSPARELELAGRVEEPPPFTPIVEVPPVPKEVVLEVPEVSTSEYRAKVEELRRKLAECRVRRDEFYLQNNEEGYRREVERMTEIAQEIGYIESQM